MSTESNEQYRAGFEAFSVGPEFNLYRNESGDYISKQTQAAWIAWVGAKREASTEPSAGKLVWLEAHGESGGYWGEQSEADCKAYGQRHRLVRVLFDSAEPSGNSGELAAGALTDDAKAQPVIWQEACGESGGYWQDSSEADCKKYGFRHRIVRVLFDSEESEAKAGSRT